MTQVLAVFILLLCLTTVYGGKATVNTSRPLKCYHCSALSWEDCDRNKEVFNCSDVEESCADGVTTGKRGDEIIKVYGKFCLNTTLCDDCPGKFENPSIETIGCDVSCCDEDLCNGANGNGAKVPMVSVIMLLACTLEAVLRYCL